MTRIIEVIPARRWQSTDGRTASLYGAVPYTNTQDKANWSLVQAGWTWRLSDGRIGLGRKPAVTHEEAMHVMDEFNQRRTRLR